MVGLYREDLGWKVQGRGQGMPVGRTEGHREERAACGHFDMLNGHLTFCGLKPNSVDREHSCLTRNQPGHISGTRKHPRLKLDTSRLSTGLGFISLGRE